MGMLAMEALLDNRKTAILFSVIDMYVVTAEPVSSQAIVDAGAVDASPATIRNEMGLLEDAGFLAQPHTSAGRVPTAAAYRRYVEYLLDQQTLVAPVQIDIVVRVLESEDSPREAGKGIARALADIVPQAIIIGFGRGDAYATGLSNLIDQPEFQDPALLREFSRAIDRLDETVDAVDERVGSTVSTFIGEENPFGAQCATIASRYALPPGNTVTLGIVGPMRMAYGEPLGALTALHEFLARRS